mmetsp:Transcript_7281/g.15656  ORF Transcript_7281/g.15656 Transcript_7281/m.15656 type:complete len:82 (-) Transcript_7281:129-374(-)
MTTPICLRMKTFFLERTLAGQLELRPYLEHLTGGSQRRKGHLERNNNSTSGFLVIDMWPSTEKMHKLLLRLIHAFGFCAYI